MIVQLVDYFKRSRIGKQGGRSEQPRKQMPSRQSTKGNRRRRRTVVWNEEESSGTISFRCAHTEIKTTSHWQSASCLAWGCVDQWTCLAVFQLAQLPNRRASTNHSQEKSSSSSDWGSIGCSNDAGFGSGSGHAGAGRAASAKLGCARMTCGLPLGAGIAIFAENTKDQDLVQMLARAHVRDPGDCVNAQPLHAEAAVPAPLPSKSGWIPLDTELARAQGVGPPHSLTGHLRLSPNA